MGTKLKVYIILAVFSDYFDNRPPVCRTDRTALIDHLSMQQCLIKVKHQSYLVLRWWQLVSLRRVFRHGNVKIDLECGYGVHQMAEIRIDVLSIIDVLDHTALNVCNIVSFISGRRNNLLARVWLIHPYLHSRPAQNMTSNSHNYFHLLSRLLFFRSYLVLCLTNPWAVIFFLCIFTLLPTFVMSIFQLAYWSFPLSHGMSETVLGNFLSAFSKPFFPFSKLVLYRLWNGCLWRLHTLDSMFIVILGFFAWRLR